MKAFVLDCSVVMSWCFEDEASKGSDAVLDRLMEDRAFVPALWFLEVANVLLVAERRKRLVAGDASRFLDMLRELPIEVDDAAPRRAWGEPLHLAREYGLSSYDACYLELALRKKLPLATGDGNLKKAAHRCGVKTL